MLQITTGYFYKTGLTLAANTPSGTYTVLKLCGNSSDVNITPASDIATATVDT
jgi:hypothetical protein